MGNSISIITPVHVHSEKRRDDLYRALHSVWNQTYNHYLIELIVINDGSTIPFELTQEPNGKQIKVVLLEQPHYERIIAYNAGLKASTGDVIMFLDSDDEFDPAYCERVMHHFRENQERMLLNFGCVYKNKDGTEKKRGPFVMQDHQVFGGGNIVNGTFVFKREVYETC